MVRVTRLVGVLALGVLAAVGVLRLQQLESVAPESVRSQAAGPAVFVLREGGTAQPAGKWTPAAPLLLRSEADAALTRDFAAQSAEVVEGTGFVRSPDGFTAKVLEANSTRGAIEAAEAALSARGGLRLELPARGEGVARLSLPGTLTLKVREVGARGEGRQVQGAVAYGRSGGRSYWRATDTGYEEWVLVAAAGEGSVAEWEVRGGQLKQDGDDVLVADASGHAQLRVTAPKAYGPGGQPARAWLRAEGNVVALYTTARGHALVDPAWTATGSMTTARESHTATRLPSGKVLVAGGYGNNGALASAELYDPAAGTWAATGSMATARTMHTATLLASGKVLVAGGGQGANTATASAELYDPAAGTWSATGLLTVARYGQTATLLVASGKVLVAGGYNPGALNLASAELYDPVAGMWTATGSMSLPRYGHTATVLPSGKVLVAGEHANNGTGTSASAELFDPTAGTWAATGSMSTGRAFFTATLLTSGKVLVAGGFGGSPAAVLGSAELYDPTAGTWSTTGSLASVREEHTATLLSSGKVLIAGGADNANQAVANAEQYDPAAGTWSTAGSMVTGRYNYTATLLPSGEVFVAGGAAYSPAISASAELYSAAATALAISPPSVTLAPSAMQTFTASGGSGTGYTWALSTNNSGGAITAAGVYTAGTTGGVTDVVKVTDSASATATATVTVSMATTALAVSPSSVTLATGATQTFTASGGSGTGYTWALATNNSGGTITAAGVYTAGSTGGVTDVVRVTDSASHTATATVTVTASSTPPKSGGGCGATGSQGALPLLAFAVLPLLVSRRRSVAVRPPRRC
jgi:predicted secreted protein